MGWVCPGLSLGRSSAPALSAPAVSRRLGEALSPAWSYPCCQARCPGRAMLCPLLPQHPAATPRRKTGPGHVWQREGGSARIPKIPAIRLTPSGVHHTASCTSTNPGWGSAPVQRIRLGHHRVSPGPAPSSIPPAASTPHHPEPWPQGISGASAGREDPGVPGPFVG